MACGDPDGDSESAWLVEIPLVPCTMELPTQKSRSPPPPPSPTHSPPPPSSLPVEIPGLTNVFPLKPGIVQSSEYCDCCQQFLFCFNFYHWSIHFHCFPKPPPTLGCPCNRNRIQTCIIVYLWLYVFSRLSLVCGGSGKFAISHALY